MRNFSMPLKRTHAIVMVGFLASALAGCNVGPKYKQPVYPAPPAFRGADEAAVVSDTQNSLGDQQWSQVFREPELQDLIRKALANNYDVRIAAQRILEQQSQVQITRSQQFPTLSVGGTAVGLDVPSLNSLNYNNSNSSSISPLAEGSFSLSAAWNPDLGAARCPDDPHPAGCDHLHSTPRARSPA
jgi:outer membrane protein, multidrug efflux system